LMWGYDVCWSNWGWAVRSEIRIVGCGGRPALSHGYDGNELFTIWAHPCRDLLKDLLIVNRLVPVLLRTRNVHVDSLARG
jgi:hypothetical protein